MSNHNRGLWGYHGFTRGGHELTVQATGIGGPSAVVVLRELAELGLRRAIRVGTCASSSEQPPLGAGLVVGGALAADGATAALGFPAGTELAPDPELTSELLRVTSVAATLVISRDLPAAEGIAEAVAAPAAPISDLQTAAVLAGCRSLGIRAAGVLAVATNQGRRLEDEPLERAMLQLADTAAATLSATKSL